MHHTWRFMRSIFAIEHETWMCMGDFNEILHADEQFGVNARPESQMRSFQEVVKDCSLKDFATNVKARLDIALHTFTRIYYLLCLLWLHFMLLILSH